MVCEFAHGDTKFILVLVGATIVGSMATVWHGIVNPPRTGKTRTWNYHEQGIYLKQGEEMGRFLLGSTVVLLYPKAAQLTFAEDWLPARAVKLGESMASKR